MLGSVSEPARKLLSTIADRYAAAGSPERSGWCFDAGSVTDAHRELEASGLLQRVFGVPGGYAWRLTEAGMQQAKACA
ncbi:MAG: hypothetical protein K0R38_145 [Polyangiaceae bacterium]|jgi:hypothetical protein|nr:hypothetical protein [Polyangiaceae bacterium]